MVPFSGSMPTLATSAPNRPVLLVLQHACGTELSVYTHSYTRNSLTLKGMSTVPGDWISRTRINFLLFPEHCPESILPEEPKISKPEFKEITLEQNPKDGGGGSGDGQTRKTNSISKDKLGFQPQHHGILNAQVSRNNGKGKVNKIEMGSEKRVKGTHREGLMDGQNLGRGVCPSLEHHLIQPVVLHRQVSF